MLVSSKVVLVSMWGADCFSKIKWELCGDTSETEPPRVFKSRLGTINDVVNLDTSVRATWFHSYRQTDIESD
jgi:hypothetical protein